jgi:hypothetical protein
MSRTHPGECRAFCTCAMRKTKITKITIQTHRRTVVRSSGGQPADNGVSEKRAVARKDEPADIGLPSCKENKENKVNE